MRRIARVGGRIVALVLLLSFGFPGLPGTAHAAHVQCNTVITQSGVDITLDSDVGPCPTDGIIIRANNVTLNLNGFDIRGDSNPTTQNVGVRIEGTQNRVVDCAKPFDSVPPCAPGRQDSEVMNFNAGIVILGGSSNEVCRITSRDNIGTRLGDFGDGILVSGSNSNTIVNNTVQGNGPFAGITLLGDSDSNKIGQPISPDVDGASLRTTCDGGNTVRENIIPSGPQEDDGIRIEPTTGTDRRGNPSPVYPNTNEIQNNLVADNGLDGLTFFPQPPNYTGSTSNKVTSNTIEGNGFAAVLPHRKGDGIRIFLPRTRELAANNILIEDNVIRDNAAHGIVLGSQSNEVKRNTITGNGVLSAAGIEPSDPGQRGFGINIQNDKNVIKLGNTISGNVGGGVNLERGATGNQINQNTVTNHTGGSGIRTETSAVGNHIVNNTATGNGPPPAGFDLQDDNPNADPVPPCESNTWQSNQEVTKNQPCID